MIEVRGTTHLKAALDALYIYQSYRSSYNFLYTHIYGQNLVTVKIDNRWIVPVANDFREFATFIKSDRINPFESAKCVFPLIPTNTFINYICTIKKTADPLMKALLTGEKRDTETLRTVKSSSGEIYYGSSGCVFDKDLNPLIIFAMEIAYPEGKVTKLNPVCIINPIVFQREDLLSKYIVKKVIPLLSDYNVHDRWDDRNFVDTRMKTIISHEIRKFIERPAKPVGFLDRELWKCAEDNINEMLEEV